MKIELIICIAGLSLLALILVSFGIQISLAKKKLSPEHYLRKAKKKFWGVLILAIVLNILPILIPLKPWVIAVVEGCGCAGSMAVLRDRLQSLKNAPGGEE